MGLHMGLSSALSGLMSSQRNLEVISHNIANVNTPDFSRKSMTQQSRVIQGRGIGVTLGDIRRTIDEGLLGDVRREGSALTRLKVVDEFMTRVQDLFGRLDSNAALNHTIGDFKNSLVSLSGDVAKPAAHWTAVNSADSLAHRLRDLSGHLQDMREEADREIEASVQRANELLKQIHGLNTKIGINAASGAGVTDLEDKRDSAITQLSELMNVKYYARSDGTISVYSNSGKPLVEGKAMALEFTPATNITAWMSYGSGGYLSGVSVDGTDITADFQEGRIKALLDSRDKNLSGLQSQLDGLAKALKDEMNRVHNRGVSFPNGGQVYNGSRSFIRDPATGSYDQAITFSGGDTAMALFDNNGVQQAATTVDTIMQAAGFPANGPWTVGDVVGEMNTWLQARLGPGNHAQIDANGRVSINIPTTSGLNLGFLDRPTTAGEKDITIQFDADFDGVNDPTYQTQGFANFLGLKDLFTGRPPNSMFESGGVASNFALAQDSTLLLQDTTGQLGGPIGGITLTAGSSLREIAAQINRLSVSHDSQYLPAAYTAPAAMTLDITQNGVAAATINIGAGDTLGAIALNINTNAGNGIRAEVATDGTNSWLRITDAEGDELSFGGTFTTAVAGSVQMTRTQNAFASVTTDGNSQRLRIVGASTQREMYLTGTITQNPPLQIRPGSTSAAEYLDVNAAIKATPSLINRTAMTFDAANNRYVLSEADGTMTADMAAALDRRITIPGYGDLGTGSFSLQDYASNIVATTARKTDTSRAEMQYQEELHQSLKFQHESIAGVNLDEEVAQLMVYQQSYTASAKVISTLQQLMDVLMNTIR